jgi:hypothetical protein
MNVRSSVVCLFAVSTAPAAAQSFSVTEQALILAGDSEAGDELGSSVAVSGNTAVVGAPREDASGADAGAAYVFTRSGTIWTEQAKLTASDALAGDRFGEFVAVEGDTLVVGVKNKNGHTGAAYVFDRVGSIWTESTVLSASDASADDQFGAAVSIDGDTLAVGARRDDHVGGVDAGAAYVFTRSGTVWSEQAKLVAGDAAADDRFGGAVSVDADTLVAGAKKATTPSGTESGAVYVFVRAGTTWAEQAKLDGLTAKDEFGRAVDVSGDSLVVSAPFEGGTATFRDGIAFVFERAGTTWSLADTLTPIIVGEHYFGWSVAIDGDFILIGVPSQVGNGVLGQAILYARSTSSWKRVSTLIGSNTSGPDDLAWSVDLDGQTMITGSPRDSHSGGFEAGSANVFVSNSVSYCSPGVSANGCTALVSATGFASASAPTGFTVHTTGLEGHRRGLHFYTTNGRASTPWGNGTSLRCVAPPVIRAGVQSGRGTLGFCDGFFDEDLHELWTAKPLKNPGEGAVVQLQGWYRDPFNTSNRSTSFSNAIEFVVGP